jgi:protein-S-isoprenylcysteine O-methyltransferase Ste14
MKNKILATSILWILTAGGQVLAAWLLYDPSASSDRINLGWLIIFVSGVFGWLPIFTFRSRGKVKGRSYVHTTVLVDSGIYSIVRHPQYLAGLLINIALPLITWHWWVILLGIASAGMYWWSAAVEEEQNLEKFGEAYQAYMERVPRFNFLLGLARSGIDLFREKGNGHQE